MVPASASPGPAESEATVWLSGEIVTAFNKWIGPVMWVLILGWFLAARSGELFDSLREVPRVRLEFAAFMVASGFLLWFAARVQRVGYAGGSLVISDFFRTVRVPFAEVSAVGPVWWYRVRLVRIRLRTETVFGDTIYYLPKWAAARCLWARPDEELREIVAARRGGPG